MDTWSRLAVAHATAFALLLGPWTWKLLQPRPVPEAVEEGLAVLLAGDGRFYFAKAIHVGGYALLALLAATLPLPARVRWALVALLALHGVATEVGQTFVPGRTGSRRDVLIDLVGIGLGVLAWRLGRRRARSVRTAEAARG